MTRPSILLFFALAATACKKPTPTVDAAVVASATASSAAEDAGDPLADDEEIGVTTDAGCPIPVHPGYCRRSCKPFLSRKGSRHAARVSDPSRSAIGTCDKYDVFAERDAHDAGIIEYYDTTGSLVAAHDDRQHGCSDFGTIPTCTPVLAWKPAPTVKFGQATIVGGLPHEVVERIMRQRFGVIRTCYENALDRDPSIHGELVLSIVIPATGDHATVTKTKDSTVTDAPLVTCIVDAAQAASFPAPIPPGLVTATMKLTFGSK